MFKQSAFFLSSHSLRSFHASSAASKASCQRHVPWPEMGSAGRTPTPYEIFQQKAGSPYSKQRFYELVKLYHPDRHDHNISVHGLSHATKLERYRLVVAANHILSDPVKRGAYDCYGAGWNGSPDVASPRDPSGTATTSWGAYTGRGWGADPRGPSNNATWEDWEKWYQRDEKGPQDSKFVSNSTFVGLIMAFALIGSIGQASRAGSYGLDFVEQRDSLHRNISRDLMRRRQETTTAYGSREERINSFLRQRGPAGVHAADQAEEIHSKTLPPPEMCSSGDIKQRPMGVTNDCNG